VREKYVSPSDRDGHRHLSPHVIFIIRIFGIHIPVIFGERKQDPLGRLLHDIVARLEDITALDWIGRPSELNSCLPADITSYKAPPHPRTLLSLSEDEIEESVCSLQNAGVVELASALYTLLDNLCAPCFANSRLQLPSIEFSITEVNRRRGPDRHPCLTYGVQTDGLQALLITTEDRVIQFWPARPAEQTFLLVRPRNRYALDCLTLQTIRRAWQIRLSTHRSWMIRRAQKIGSSPSLRQAIHSSSLLERMSLRIWTRER